MSTMDERLYILWVISVVGARLEVLWGCLVGMVDLIPWLE